MRVSSVVTFQNTQHTIDILIAYTYTYDYTYLHIEYVHIIKLTHTFLIAMGISFLSECEAENDCT